jgi:hypothetical protein
VSKGNKSGLEVQWKTQISVSPAPSLSPLWKSSNHREVTEEARRKRNDSDAFLNQVEGLFQFLFGVVEMR